MEQKSADQHDKAILAIASGGLALSVTFLKDIAPHPLPETWKYLGISWVCFVVSILAILLSFLTSQSACRKQRDFLDDQYQKVSPIVADKKNCWSVWFLVFYYWKGLSYLPAEYCICKEVKI